MWNKVNALLICGLTFALLSCTENPLTIVPDKTTQSRSSEGAITLIPLPKASASLSKEIIISDTKLITAKSGGTLQVYFEYQGTNGKATVNVSLNVPAGALLYDQYLTMTLGEETLSGSVFVNTIFGPHGTTFLTPALLNIDAKGLDLSSLPPNADVQLYYFNSDSNTYELMVVKKETCNLHNGMIKCQDGQLNHFSRYAFGYVR